MADNAALLAEAYKRGILPPDKKAAYEEAARRGLVPPIDGKGRALADARKRAASTPGQVRAISQGASFGFSDELDALGAGAETGVRNAFARVGIGKAAPYSASEARQAVMQAEKEALARFRAEHPVQNFAGEMTGGIATGRAVLRGAQAVGQGIRAVPRVANALAPLTRAAPVGSAVRAGAAAGAQGAAYGAGTAESGQRARGAAIGGVTGFGVGSALQAGGNALSGVAQRAAARAAANPSDARILSNMGIDLTPGKMIGGIAQRVEDAMTSVPGVGDQIRARNTDSLRDLNRVATNRALAPINEALPQNIRPGRDAIQYANRAISGAYNRALSPVTIAPDAQYTADIGRAVAGAQPRVQADVQGIVDDVIGTQFNGPINGQAWKAIDEELGTTIRQLQAGEGANPANRAIRRALEQVRAAHQAALRRTSAQAADAVDAADEAFANMVRVNKAAQKTSTAKTDGLFGTNALNQGVAQGSGRAYGEGGALMQDISDPATRVLPSTVPDSGTPIRSLLTGVGTVGGAFAGASAVGGAAPAVVLGGAGASALGAAVYSRPVMRLLNAAYRAKNPGQTRAAVAELQRLAARNPQLRNEVSRAIASLRGEGDGQQGTQPSQ